MLVVFNLGFRPFFLLSGVFAVILMALWIPAFTAGRALSTYYGQIGWHSHEMIFGYVAGVIAGFLLTAVRNWTGRATATGGSLAALLTLWLLGRILPFFAATIPAWLISVVDLAFLPALTVSIAMPLMRQGEKRNLLFLPLMLGFFAGNLLVHLELLGLVPGVARHGVFLGLYLIILLIVIMGGRVIPFFTEAGFAGCCDQAPACPRMARAFDRDRVYACRDPVPELGSNGSLGRTYLHHQRGSDGELV